ncbi:hypothetical protein [Dietzia sp. 111N12-1]|uniref:hypothetical protein n=1 Tax=Dietzia sp. 111N12-1 TaxID=1785156 RepID=UPI0020A2EB3D|nr:hypothetical protein [Dietzia sp. 111N12-1]
MLAIILDLAVLVPFLLTKSQSDPFTLVITALVALAIVLAQWLAVRHHQHQ